MQEIIIIVAMAENRVIGKDNAMPWSIKGNLAHFKEMTMGWPCIMGRKTWESLPKKPLPGRLNIIVSKTMTANDLPDVRETQQGQEVKIFPSLTSAVEYCEGYEKVFICGGESIYKQALPLANKLDLTLIPGQYEGDAYFPEIDNSWIKKDTINFDEFSVVTYIKKEQI
jgi:dihydrofolate reductase